VRSQHGRLGGLEQRRIDRPSGEATVLGTGYAVAHRVLVAQAGALRVGRGRRFAHGAARWWLAVGLAAAALGVPAAASGAWSDPVLIAAGPDSVNHEVLALADGSWLFLWHDGGLWHRTATSDGVLDAPRPLPRVNSGRPVAIVRGLYMRVLVRLPDGSFGQLKWRSRYPVGTSDELDRVDGAVQPDGSATLGWISASGRVFLRAVTPTGEVQAPRRLSSGPGKVASIRLVVGASRRNPCGLANRDRPTP
jgi:hypothetical protein